jgi:hypothetical protein
MSEQAKPNYKNTSIGLFETVFKSGKLAGKRGYTGRLTPEQYDALIGRLAPGSGVFLTINEFKTESKHPEFRLTFSEPREGTTETKETF